MNKTLVIILVGLLALLGGVSARNLVSSVSHPAQQNTLPEFNLADLSGKQHSINEWQNKVRIINFWATWCSPCLNEMPELNALQTQFADKNLQIIGIALDDPDPVKEFISTHKISYPILLGEDKGIALSRSLGNLVNAIPFTVVVDKKGQIVKSYMGEIKSSQLMDTIKSLL